MSRSLRKAQRVRAGFTLLEAMIAVSIFSLVGYGLFLAMDIGNDSHGTVLSVTANSRAVRESSRILHDELSATSDASIQVAVLPDQNNSLTFQVPITVEANPSWGVYDRRLGATEAEWNREDWSIRYTVVSQVIEGTQTRRLMRQLLDEVGDAQFQETIAENLCAGTGEAPGFRVEDTGEVWLVTCSTSPDPEHQAISTNTFHIRTRN
jgi:prepilin-type N-terminal cleavage/methylation domain-containing protein